jgi:para-aminobenzoate synthetase/4-amino-4-deoxychorismate lyase
VREPLDWNHTPQDVLRMLRGDERPFLLLGAWAGGGAILSSNPVAGAERVAIATESAPVVVGGGWFGWLGYGFGAEIERLPPQPPRPHPLPTTDVAFYDHVFRLDPEGRWWFEALEPREVPRLAAPERRSWSLDGMRPRAPGFDGHRWAVTDAVRRITEGEIFQANLTLRLEGALNGDPLDAFADATEHHAPPYSAFFKNRDHSVLSFSPELFLRRRGGVALSSPIKGTATDEAALRDSNKDAAEHVMIVDLVRNDLGRVADYGTVTVHEPRIEEHPGLFHMVSDVEAETHASDEDLVRAAFPPGSVTGAPKVQAMKVIAALEATGREVYTGAIGYLSPHQGLELNVAIRTLEVRGEKAWLGVGGGIVAQSEPEQELQEALTKARPVLSALNAKTPDPTVWRRRRLPPLLAIDRPDPRKGVMETMLAIDGHIPLLDDHLQRLGDDSARAELEEAARTAGAGRWRIRLLGDVVEVAPAKGREPVLRPALIPGGLGDRKWADRRFPSDVLIVDADGEVLEAGWANVFIVEDGRHITPPLDGRLLPGVVRARVDADEEPITLERYEAADAVYLTSAVSLITPVRGAAFAPSASAVLPAGLGSSPARGR